MTQQLAVREVTDLAPHFVVSLDDLKRQMQELERFKREIMLEGEDYGVIPGTAKPTLLKPGAEKLAMVFGLAPTFPSDAMRRVEDWEHGFFHYEVECRLISKRTGEVVASASGSANTREPRYRWRKAERVCPNCQQPAIIKGKADFGGGWLCWAKRGGCGTKFSAGDQRIEGQTTGNVENPEPWELVNTVLKMAQKRALVAATLIATGGSGVWTQDIEDMPSVASEAVVIDQEPARAPAQQHPPRVPPLQPSTGELVPVKPRQRTREELFAKYQELFKQAQDIGIPVDGPTYYADETTPREELIAKGKTLSSLVAAHPTPEPAR